METSIAFREAEFQSFLREYLPKFLKEVLMEAVMCPVCGGNGIVDEGFYRQTSGQWTSAGGTETCRSCGGKGYVVIPPTSPKPINIENSLSLNSKYMRDALIAEIVDAIKSGSINVKKQI